MPFYLLCFGGFLGPPAKIDQTGEKKTKKTLVIPTVPTGSNLSTGPTQKGPEPQAAAVLGIALIAFGEECGAGLGKNATGEREVWWRLVDPGPWEPPPKKKKRKRMVPGSPGAFLFFFLICF